MTSAKRKFSAIRLRSIIINAFPLLNCCKHFQDEIRAFICGTDFNYTL
jgi:hypothetical protein